MHWYIHSSPIPVADYSKWYMWMFCKYLSISFLMLIYIMTINIEDQTGHVS